MTPSLTPVEDGYRRMQAESPLPADPFAACVIRALRAAKIEEAHLLDQGRDWDAVLSLASSIAASVLDSAANTFLSTAGRNHPSNVAALKAEMLDQVAAMLRRRPGHHTSARIDRGDEPGRG